MEVTNLGDVDNRIAKLEKELSHLKSIRNISLKLSSGKLFIVGCRPEKVVHVVSHKEPL